MEIESCMFFFILGIWHPQKQTASRTCRVDVSDWGSSLTRMRNEKTDLFSQQMIPPFLSVHCVAQLHWAIQDEQVKCAPLVGVLMIMGFQPPEDPKNFTAQLEHESSCAAHRLKSQVVNHLICHSKKGGSTSAGLKCLRLVMACTTIRMPFGGGVRHSIFH